ncbi:hypothetical protein [Thalassospira sp.]|uniref:hypothetical protein n=1 Tax=Thalassospira sp. TaxID=1912094 RepID=UPI002733A366|nr:hypothetical protein [Thalassospira sp.]MDP2697657.1 hypothetical protein [Thalassospira sp.]
MKQIAMVLIASGVMLGAFEIHAEAITPASSVLIAEGAIHHGGGCRKSSPPGQCCHMDNSVGTVHCH